MDHGSLRTIHDHVVILDRLSNWRDLVLVDHVPPPVVFPGERAAALSRPRALGHRAVELASLLMLVVDVTVQMGLGAEPHGAARVGALVWSFVVAFVMAIVSVSDLCMYER